jgi:hypothetical protein
MTSLVRPSPTAVRHEAVTDMFARRHLPCYGVYGTVYGYPDHVRNTRVGVEEGHQPKVLSSLVPT